MCKFHEEGKKAEEEKKNNNKISSCAIVGYRGSNVKQLIVLGQSLGRDTLTATGCCHSAPTRQTNYYIYIYIYTVYIYMFIYIYIERERTPPLSDWIGCQASAKRDDGPADDSFLHALMNRPTTTTSKRKMTSNAAFYCVEQQHLAISFDNKKRKTQKKKKEMAKTKMYFS